MNGIKCDRAYTQQLDATPAPAPAPEQTVGRTRDLDDDARRLGFDYRPLPGGVCVTLEQGKNQ